MNCEQLRISPGEELFLKYLVEKSKIKWLSLARLHTSREILFLCEDLEKKELSKLNELFLEKIKELPLTSLSIKYPPLCSVTNDMANFVHYFGMDQRSYPEYFLLFDGYLTISYSDIENDLGVRKKNSKEIIDSLERKHLILKKRGMGGNEYKIVFKYELKEFLYSSLFVFTNWSNKIDDFETSEKYEKIVEYVGRFYDIESIFDGEIEKVLSLPTFK